MPSQAPAPKKKGSFFRNDFFQLETESQKKAALWIMVSVLTAIIIIIWSFFFRYNLSLINAPKSGEEADQRKTEWKEIEEKFKQAMEDWPKSFQKPGQKDDSQIPKESQIPVENNSPAAGQ